MVLRAFPELAPKAAPAHVDPCERPADRDRPRQGRAQHPRPGGPAGCARHPGHSGSPRPPSARPRVAAAMLRGGAVGLGDSRVENLARLRAGGSAPRTLIRSPMLSQVAQVVRTATASLNTEAAVLAALDDAAAHAADPPRRGPHGRARRPPRRHRRRRRRRRRSRSSLASRSLRLRRPRRQPGLPERGRARRREHGRAAPARRPDRGAPRHHPRRRLRRQLRQPGLGADDGPARPHQRAAPRRGDPARHRAPRTARRSPA